MSSLLDRLKVKNIPEKKTEYKILIPRKKSDVIRKPRKTDVKKDGEKEDIGDIFAPKDSVKDTDKKKKVGDGKEKGVAIVDMTDNTMDFSDFFNKARGLVFVDDRKVSKQVEQDISEMEGEGEMDMEKEKDMKIEDGVKKGEK